MYKKTYLSFLILLIVSVAFDGLYWNFIIRIRAEYIIILAIYPLVITSLILNPIKFKYVINVLLLSAPFFLASLISLIFSEEYEYPIKSIFSYITYTSILIFFVLYIRNYYYLRKILNVWMSIGVLMSILAVGQVLGYIFLNEDILLNFLTKNLHSDINIPMDPTFRARAFFGDPNTFAAFLLCSYPFLFSKIIHKYIFFGKIQYIQLTFLFIMFAAILLTASKSGILGIFASTFAIFFIQPWTKNSAVKKIRLCKFMLLNIALLCSLFLNDFIFTAVSNRLYYFNDFSDGNGHRLELARIAYEIWLDNPILGVGMNNFQIFYSRDYGGEMGWGVHSHWIQLLSDLGIIGLLTGLVFQIYLLRYSLHIIKYEKIIPFLGVGAFGGIIGLITSNIAYATISFSYVSVFYGFILATYFLLRSQPPIKLKVIND